MKNKVISSYIICIICIFFLAFVSCSSSKKTKEEKKVKKKSVKYIQKKLEKTIPEYEWFSSKAKVTYIKPDGSSQTFTSNLRMKKDSVIWISITPLLGIEMARVMITKDEVQIIDRVKKKYYKKDKSLIKNYIDYPVDFNLLQNALLGLPLYNMDTKETRSDISGNMFFMENIVKNVVNRIWINPTKFTINKMQLYDEENYRRLDVLLDNFEKVGKAKFSRDREIKVLNKEAHKIKIHYSRTDFDKALKFPFTVSDKYERIED